MTAETFTDLLAVQHAVQLAMPAGDPALLSAEERATFVVWNFWALTCELVEASEEVGWKPWATSRHLNKEKFKGELVDAFCFLMNLMLAGGITADEFVDQYKRKSVRNIERQREGYTGIDKCPGCHRDAQELPEGHPVYWSETKNRSMPLDCSDPDVYKEN